MGKLISNSAQINIRNSPSSTIHEPFPPEILPLGLQQEITRERSKNCPKLRNDRHPRRNCCGEHARGFEKRTLHTFRQMLLSFERLSTAAAGHNLLPSPCAGVQLLSLLLGGHCVYCTVRNQPHSEPDRRLGIPDPKFPPLGSYTTNWTCARSG